MQTMLRLEDVRADLDDIVEIVPPHWVDDDELFALGDRFEHLLFERFADGTILVTPPPGWKSTTGEAELVGQIMAWYHATWGAGASASRGGIVQGPTGGILFPDRALLVPDATYISAQRWARADRERSLADAVPDAAFELLSKSDRVPTTMKKIRTYLRNGVRLAVLIVPWRQRVYAGRDGDAEPHDLGDIERLDCSPVMPGFVLNVAALRAAW